MQRMTPKLHDRIRELLGGGMTRQQVSEETTASPNQVRRVATGFYAKPGNPDELKPKEETRTEVAERVLGNWQPRGAVPTSEEIAEACRLLRQARPASDLEEEHEPVWCVPIVRTPTFDGRAAA